MNDTTIERIASRIVSASAVDEALEVLRREHGDKTKTPAFRKLWESVRNVLEKGEEFSQLEQMISNGDAFRAFSEKVFQDSPFNEAKHVWYKIKPMELDGDKLKILVSMEEIRGREAIRFSHANKVVQMKIKPGMSLKKIFREAVDWLVKSGPEASGLFHRYGYPKFDKL